MDTSADMSKRSECRAHVRSKEHTGAYGVHIWSIQGHPAAKGDDRRDPGEREARKDTRVRVLVLAGILERRSHFSLGHGGLLWGRVRSSTCTRCHTQAQTSKKRRIRIGPLEFLENGSHLGFTRHGKLLSLPSRIEMRAALMKQHGEWLLTAICIVPHNADGCE